MRPLQGQDMVWSPLFPCIYHTNGWKANEKWRWGPLSLWFSEDVSCHSSPSRAHLAVRMNPISLFSFTSLWNWQALLFFSSLSTGASVSPPFLLYLPYIALFSQCEQQFSLHSHFFLSPIFRLISLFFTLCSHSHRLELTKIELCLLIVKLIWLTFFCETQKVNFWRISQAIILYIKKINEGWGCQAPKWQ